MDSLYVVRDGERTVWLAVHHRNRLYVYVPNIKTFAYNGPLSTDFLIDRDHTYTPIEVAEAAKIVAEGRVGRIDPRSNGWLLEHFRAEPAQLDPGEVLGRGSGD